jgi:hypothetical protein
MQACWGRDDENPFILKVGTLRSLVVAIFSEVLAGLWGYKLGTFKYATIFFAAQRVTFRKHG